MCSYTSGSLPISIFKLEPLPNGGNRWKLLITASFFVQQIEELTCSFSLQFAGQVVCTMQKDTFKHEEQTSCYGKGETFDGPCWLALRFFTNNDARDFKTHISNEETERKRSQMMRKMQFVVEVERLEGSFATYFSKIDRRNHLKHFCQILAPFVYSCERPSYRNFCLKCNSKCCDIIGH